MLIIFYQAFVSGEDFTFRGINREDWVQAPPAGRIISSPTNHLFKFFGGAGDFLERKSPASFVSPRIPYCPFVSGKAFIYNKMA